MVGIHVWTISDFVCKLRHVRSFYRPFLTEKTPENAKLVEIPNNFSWCLELVIWGPWKKGVISRMSRNNMLSDGAFWVPEHTSFNMVYFYTCLKWCQLFPLGGHALIGIHARFEQFPTPYASCDISSLFSAFSYREKSRKNTKLVGNQNNLSWFLELAIQGHRIKTRAI